MKFAFLVDPLPALKPAKDSSVAMMRAAAARGHEVFAIGRDGLQCRDGQVFATAQRLTLEPPDADPWCATAAAALLPLVAFDAVLMRQDPPFDMEYVAATWLLERAERGGARVFNRPAAIRDHSEKLAIAEFPEFSPVTLVCRDMADVQSFIDEHGDVVLKPLDGMGGAGVFRVRADDPNRNVIVETVSVLGTRTLMAQRYLPGIAHGDKRVLLIAGEPVPYCLARIPQGGDLRGNLAAGGKGVARPLLGRDREIAEALAPLLWARGLFIVGLDIIGEHLTEINVTSPTCFVEITTQTRFDVAAMAIARLEAICAAPG